MQCRQELHARSWHGQGFGGFLRPLWSREGVEDSKVGRCCSGFLGDAGTTSTGGVDTFSAGLRELGASPTSMLGAASRGTCCLASEGAAGAVVGENSGFCTGLRGGQGRVLADRHQRQALFDLGAWCRRWRRRPACSRRLLQRCELPGSGPDGDCDFWRRIARPWPWRRATRGQAPRRPHRKLRRPLLAHALVVVLAGPRCGVHAGGG
mmetsp:Transcript_20187/g.56265  ORF Transcript_20187/g.56265 Transcript_20187/m.56265 type:complete len:208 (-) Transcript_20187:168-791(-)